MLATLTSDTLNDPFLWMIPIPILAIGILFFWGIYRINRAANEPEEPEAYPVGKLADLDNEKLIMLAIADISDALPDADQDIADELRNRAGWE